jgi:hypothetical protein
MDMGEEGRGTLGGTAVSGDPAVVASPIEVAQAPGPEPRASVGNYIVRHWRGELSLPVSYWVNGFLLTTALVLALRALPHFLELETMPARGIGASMLLSIAITVSVGIWQAVGIWRSAQNYKSRGDGRGWAITAQVLVVFGALRLISFAIQDAPVVEEGVRLLLGTDRTPPSHLRLVEGNTEIEVAGGLTHGTVDALETLLDKNPTVRLVRLNSVGGFVSEGDRLGQLISERGLSTVTMTSAPALAFSRLWEVRIAFSDPMAV